MSPGSFMSDQLLNVFAKGLGIAVEELSDDTNPDNTPQWDSLAAMELVTLIEDEFDVRLKTGEIMRMRSIALARQVLTSKGVAGT